MSLSLVVFALAPVLAAPATATEVPPAPVDAVTPQAPATTDEGAARSTAPEPSAAEPASTSPLEPAPAAVETPLEPAPSSPPVLAPPARAGEGMMITGWSFLGGGLTMIGSGVAFAVTDVYDGGFGELARIAVAGPTFILGGVTTLLGAGLVGGGYGRWHHAYKTWGGYPAQADPRGRPVRQRPALLLMPGGVLLVAGLVTFTFYGLSEVDELLVPAAISTATGVALMGAGLVLRSRLRSRATRAMVSPSFARTRQGTWTGGVVMRW